MARSQLTIEIGGLSEAIRQITKEYGDEARKALEESAEVAAKKTVETLKSTSPKRTGTYSKSWRIKRELTKSGSPKLTVYNHKHGNLTHLLEFGHDTRSGGRTRAFPHIKPAEKEAIKLYEEELRKKL